LTGSPWGRLGDLRWGCGAGHGAPQRNCGLPRQSGYDFETGCTSRVQDSLLHFEKKRHQMKGKGKRETETPGRGPVSRWGWGKVGKMRVGRLGEQDRKTVEGSVGRGLGSGGNSCLIRTEWGRVPPVQKGVRGPGNGETNLTWGQNALFGVGSREWGSPSWEGGRLWGCYVRENCRGGDRCEKGC